jgi:hypothetical protein
MAATGPTRPRKRLGISPKNLDNSNLDEASQTRINRGNAHAPFPWTVNCAG